MRNSTHNDKRIVPEMVLGAPPDTPLAVVVDTREQEPFRFPPEYATSRNGTLRLGDYAVDGDDTLWAVERKSMSDFISSWCGAGELRKVQRMRAAWPDKWPIVYVVEGGWIDFYSWEWSRCKRATSQWCFSRLCDVAVKYNVRFEMCGSRRLAAMMCLRWLRTRAKAIGSI